MRSPTPRWDAACRIRTATLGEAWLEVAREILTRGRRSAYDGKLIAEISEATLEITEPASDDAIISAFADPDRLEWMRRNFLDDSLVEALGDARSYASRFRDYGGQARDQIAWVIERLTADPTSRSASITTFEPLLDTTYIPCVSLLDFWIPEGRLDLIVYAHSIDFGAKGYANLVQLAELQHEVATGLEVDLGRLTMIVKSAHIYDPEEAWMRSVLDRADARPGAAEPEA